MTPRTDNTLTVHNQFDLSAVFEIAMWLTLRDAVSFLTVNNGHHTLLKQNRFWIEKVNALNFVDFLLRVNSLTKAAQESMFASLMTIEDRKMMDLILSMDHVERYNAFYVYRFRKPPKQNTILLSDGAVIALFEKLVDIHHIETDSRLFALLDNNFILNALRDKLTSIEALLKIERQTLNEVIKSYICNLLNKLIKEKVNSIAYINVYHENKNDTSYEISFGSIEESQKNLICQQFLDLGIKTTGRKEYLYYITLETSAHNLRLALQKMPVLKKDKPFVSQKNARATKLLFFPHQDTQRVVIVNDSLIIPTLRPKKPRRV